MTNESPESRDSVITTKKQMYEMLTSGRFGNTARTWGSRSELLASGYSGLVGCRSRVPGGPFLAHVPVSEVPDGEYVYSEMQRDECVLLQGEVYRSTHGLYLFASYLKTHMRPALRDGGFHRVGVAAHVELARALWPTDLDALRELLDTYDSVVEFSAYDRAVGILPMRNTLIWEVRNY